MRALIAGNWKMNGTSASLAEIRALARYVSANRPPADLLICPPATLLSRAVEAASGHFPIGGQDCHAEAAGAFTGDVSAEMLRDAGAMAVIVGHSERRQYHGETDAIVAAKASAAHRAGLLAIICVGETESQRDAGKALSVVGSQLAASLPDGLSSASFVIAYEPVWAIGTGRTPSLGDIAEMHGHIRAGLRAKLGDAGGAARILYGGSVKPSNASEILAVADVGGALVGGASLKASDFMQIFSQVPSEV
jgi:triosephosphate isomerase